MSDLIGQKINGRYEIIRLLGQGGMAEVYEAHQALLDRKVAIKLMHRHLSSDAQFKARFEREAQAIASLKHAHIIQLYDFDFDPNLRQYFMAIEFIDGPTLGDYLLSVPNTLPLNQTLKIIEDLTDALGYAHANQMQHRDIKPSNIMLDKGSRTVLTDFGIAKIVQDSSQQLTASGAMIGTPAYLSPEQAAGLPGDHRSDIYSLGIVFFQLATGRLPYQGDTPIATILKHLKEIPPPPTSINPHLPMGVEAVILRCLAKDPVDRYQSMGDLLNHIRDLEAAAADLDNIRTISGKILPDNLLLNSNNVITTTESMVAPPKTRFFIAIGAVGIIALLSVGAFLFSTAGNQNSSMEDPCEIVLSEPITLFESPESFNPNELITLAPNIEIHIISAENDYWLVEWSEGEGWIPQEELPAECQPTQ